MEFTKEQLQQIIETDHVQCGEASALARIALTSLEAEPVVYMWDSERKDIDAPGYYRPEHLVFAESSVKQWGGRIVPLYAAAPAPVIPELEAVAWDYEWASCITCEGPQNFKRVIEREAPPEWAIEQGQARKIIPLCRMPEIN
ncbi:hypothetical protein N5C39_22480 [Enterobacter bugandensis]|uniref:Uncharacterized protein n=1 Tax=Enterobacter bugandensis TaxID=881260 RepID=A0AA42PZB2_9ENTR|nr:hypothetical protein [Enterobacter bugandensis]MDH1321142.1 hypothetical protein [Enterobacter bugandensis]